MMRKKHRNNVEKTSSNSRNKPSVPHDLTPEGYQETLRKLRKNNPAEARRLERYLEPILEERGIFQGGGFPGIKHLREPV